MGRHTFLEPDQAARWPSTLKRLRRPTRHLHVLADILTPGRWHMKKRSAVLVAAALLLAVTGCSGTTAKSGTAAAPTDPTKVTGDITVLTHKTDLAQDGTLARYAAEFNKTYPNVHVKFEP